jgi:hypothetical protein
MSRKSGYSGVLMAEEKLILSGCVDIDNSCYFRINEQLNAAFVFKTKLRPAEKSVALE